MSLILSHLSGEELGSCFQVSGLGRAELVPGGSSCGSVAVPATVPSCLPHSAPKPVSGGSHGFQLGQDFG